MIRPLPAPVGWVWFRGPHPGREPGNAQDGWRGRPTSWYRDPVNGDLWRVAHPDEQMAPAAAAALNLPDLICNPHLILDTLVVDGVRYRNNRPPDYADLKIPSFST